MHRWRLALLSALAALPLGSAPVRVPPTRPTPTSPSIKPASSQSIKSPITPSASATQIAKPAIAPVIPPTTSGYTLVYEYTHRVDADEAAKLAQQQSATFRDGVHVEVREKGNPTTITLDHLSAPFETDHTVAELNKILAANPRLDPKAMHPGDLVKVPSMPVVRGDPKAKTSVVLTRAPTASSRSPLKMKVVGPALRVNRNVGAASRTVLVNVTRQEVAAAVNKDPPPGTRAFASTGRYVARLTAEAAAGTASPAALLSPTERNNLRVLSTRAPTREVWLFILDTGWPGPTERSESLRQLYTVLDACWASIGHQRTENRLDPLGPCPTLINPHADHVAKAIEELVGTDINPNAGKHVRVVYVPIGRTQQADPLLRELATLGFFLSQLSPSQSAQPAEAQDLMASARALAASAIASLTPVDASDALSTDQAIITGLALAFGRYSASTRKTTPPLAFFNHSWVLPANEAQIGLSTDIPVIVVAAAGNDRTNNRDFVTAGDDYARLVWKNESVVAVMNAHARTGLDRSSSWTSRAPAIARKLVSYEGMVGQDAIGRDINGTSFSAPRVAWFMAFAETVRQPAGDLIDWSDNHRKWIHRAREADTPGSLLRFNPAIYLEDAVRP